MFDEHEVAGVLDRALGAGVAGILAPATGPDDIDLVLGIAKDHPNRVVAAAGVHPHEAHSLGGSMKRIVERACEQATVVAVGEIGLDYHYLNSPREDQLAALSWQLDLAIAAGLPVVLHNRESWPDLVSMLEAREGRLRGVCHSFTEGVDAAQQVVELGLWVGISGMVTFKNAENIRAIVAALEPESVLVETDSPYLAPVPHRGRENEPAFVPLVGRRLAEEWKMPVEEVARTSTTGFRTLFGVGDTWPDVEPVSAVAD